MNATHRIGYTYPYKEILAEGEQAQHQISGFENEMVFLEG